MSAGHEPGRVEVVLRPVPGSSEGAGDVGADGRSPTPQRRDRRGDVVVVGIVALVSGLAIGWVLGRASTDGSDAASTSVASAVGVEPSAAGATPVGSDEDGSGDSGGDEDDDEGAAASLEPDRTAVSADVVPIAPVTREIGEAGPVVDESVDVAASASGRPVEIVAYGNGRALMRLDLSTGRFRTQEIQRHPFGRVRLLVADDFAMLPSPDGTAPSLLVDDDGEVTDVDYGVDRRVLGVTADGRVWLSTPELGIGGAGSAERVEPDGTVIDTIELPAQPVGLDPRGGFVVADGSGWYRVADGGIARITAGELVALGAELAVARECDERLECRLVVLERASGLRRSAPDTAMPVGLSGTDGVSPDGTKALVRLDDRAAASAPQPTLAVVDLSTGAVVELGAAQDIEQATWTPDGNLVVFNAGGRIVAADPTTGASTLVSERLVGVEEFALRAVT